MIKSMGLKLSLEEVTELFDRADTDGRLKSFFINTTETKYNKLKEITLLKGN